MGRLGRIVGFFICFVLRVFFILIVFVVLKRVKKFEFFF